MFDADKISKLVALALCPAATDGEVSNAATAIFRHLRSAGVDSISIVEQKRLHNHPTDNDFVDFALVRFPFGKYNTQLVRDIAFSDPSYIEWAEANLKKIPPWLKQALSFYAESIRNPQPSSP